MACSVVICLMVGWQTLLIGNRLNRQIESQSAINSIARSKSVRFQARPQFYRSACPGSSYTIEMTITVGYARISTKDQGENAIEQQIARLIAAGADKIVKEVESARSKADRPKFNHLMAEVRQNKVKKIIVTRLDRISRSLPHLRKILDEFQKYGCDLVALDDNIDMSSAAGKFQVNMLGALAEMESDRLSERIHHGKRHFRQQKRASHPPFGYLVENYRFKIDKNPFLCTIRDKNEWSQSQIAVWLIESYLTNKSLLGSCKAFVGKFGYQLFWSTSFSRWIRNSTLEGHI